MSLIRTHAHHVLLACLLLLGLNTTAAAQFPAQERVVSPLIDEDGRVTFRLRAPAADQVHLASSGDIAVIPFGESMPMAEGEDGLWELTIGPIDPGAYRYNFNVDGVAVLDPVNPLTSASNDNPWSLFHVAGADFMDTQKVPHGAVSEVSYYSEHLQRHRRLHVYTPPGFEKSDRHYPVLYLLHGAMDSDDSWSTVGRAGFILDNLIAEGRAEPMIVVMPHGHSAPYVRGVSERPLEAFVEEFQTDIRPYIEAHYPLDNSRSRRAIAGLSMGGAQTLNIAFDNLQDFGWIGVFSSGVFSITQDDSWQQSHRESLGDERLKEGLELFWIATGEDDFLLETTHATVAMLEAHDFDVSYVETSGGHTWINWREYLHEFVPQLFK